MNIFNHKINVSKFKKIILMICLFLVLAYLGFQVVINYEIQKLQQKEIELQKEQENLEKEVKDKLRDAEIADLKQQISDLRNEIPGIKTVTNTVTVEAKDVTADIVKEWSPRVAHIECSWFYSNGSLYYRASGSVTLVNFSNLGLRAITNKHILVGKNNYAPSNCKIELLNGAVYSILINQNNITVSKTEDWAYISLPTDSTLANITKQIVKLCPSVDVGDKLLVLGYPKIGSKTGLTVTEGIVSGFDGSYYITSAKIDKGNSGGASILVKDNCYLGIPSASVVGTIESLGRILKASFVIN